MSRALTDVNKDARRRRWKRNGRRLSAACIAVAGTAVFAVGTLIAIERSVTPLDLVRVHAVSQVVVDRNDRLLRAYITPDGRWRLPVERDAVDPRYLAMLLAYEDRRFYEHTGVDARALARAALQAMRAGRVVSGASTLTMQTARLIDARHERTLVGKLRQIVRARRLEQRMSKTEIIDVYLRLAPFGGNLEGVRAASLAYLGKEPARLSIGEAALLVALPQSPEARRPDRYAAAARRARDRVLDRVAAAGVITAAEARAGKRERVASRRRTFPMYAPHLTDREVARRPDARTHRLTIDRPTQAEVEGILANTVTRLGRRLSAAAIVVDRHTGDVHALAGSSDFLSRNRFGAVDMARAIRSPGSTLKPFVYGLAFDAGIAHPETTIEDRPVRFGAYAPENFDKKYRGSLSIRRALHLSLNVPAVKVLHRVGSARLMARLRRSGVDPTLPNRSAPSLAIALGGVGLSLGDLATLYTALANEGVATPLRTNRATPRAEVSETAESRTARRLISRKAAWAITDILRGTPPPKNAPRGRIAFKTGTSYGFRDAWAVGYDGRYVVGIWVGRPDGVATPGLTGITAAAPALFDVFARLDGGKRTPFPSPPDAQFAARGAPLPLQRFRFRGAAERTDVHPLTILYPPDQSEVVYAGLARDVPRQSARGRPIVLKAEGGRKPLTWLVDGMPIESARHRTSAHWVPSGAGFSELTVIDAEGRAARARVRIRP
ncbi:MAG: penicillin-binding protein 1C [Pseudomonadota bacterium]